MKKYLPFILVFAVFLFPVQAFADESINLGTVCGDADGFGGSAGSTAFANAFTPSGNENTVTATIKVSTSGSPVDNVVVAIQADSAGVPSGVDLGTTSLLGSTFPAGSGGTCPTSTTFGIISGLTLVASTKYWLVVRRSGAITAASYFIGEQTSGSGEFVFNGSSWSQFAGTYKMFGSLALTATAPPPSTFQLWVMSLF